ncbi:hypothetical protein [Pseudoflavitalea rhizosphaerae]|uniref:hypothetical protein n=1 Tax=Pseudoflavitalea rhizosphaerae TaxID=1884793 RepID=UPI000F8EA402|nr:hypothetical protein [Pseudoflavitalea rhizosphaerae]
MKMLFRCFCSLLLLPPAFQSCNSAGHPSPLAEQNTAFDLEKIYFTENVPVLYSSNIEVEEGVRYDSARDGQLTDNMLRYRISNTITEALKLTVPQQEFGYLFRSPQMDKLAKFQNIYFQKLSTLTDKNKIPVAYYAESEFKDAKERKQVIEAFKKEYGNPVYSFLISSEFNQCSYEWQLKDRTIQIETSNGISVTFGGRDTAAKQTKYYSLRMLIINNQFKSAIHDAHIYEFPDKIMYDGKLHSYKDFQFEKKQVFRDPFLLNSTNETYVRDEFGEFDINRAAEDE